MQDEPTNQPIQPSERRRIVGRWLEYNGELRSAVLRVVLVGLFTVMAIALLVVASVVAFFEWCVSAMQAVAMLASCLPPLS